MYSWCNYYSIPAYIQLVSIEDICFSRFSGNHSLYVQMKRNIPVCNWCNIFLSCWHWLEFQNEPMNIGLMEKTDFCKSIFPYRRRRSQISSKMATDPLQVYLRNEQTCYLFLNRKAIASSRSQYVPRQFKLSNETVRLTWERQRENRQSRFESKDTKLVTIKIQQKNNFPSYYFSCEMSKTSWLSKYGLFLYKHIN